MRADKFFSEKFGSRTKAQQALLRGLVLRNGLPVSPKDDVSGDEAFVFLSEEVGFVSNGGFKLERALSCFRASVEGVVAADLGASTGGFCDCLLQHGAKKVYCVDVGKSQLDPRLASDPRVIVMDETNARYLSCASFPEKIDVVTADLSFISLRLILPALSSVLCEEGRAFVLFKPQFECGGMGLGKSGILPVRLHAELLSDFYDFAVGLGLSVRDIVNAPIRPKKNVEYVIFLDRGGFSVGRGRFLELSADLDRN